MQRCEDCIHKNVCLHKANIQTDTYAYMGVNYDTEKCEHFSPTADVVPKSEVASTAHKCEDCAGCTQWECDCSLIEEHAKAEVAREIFAEIERMLDNYHYSNLLVGEIYPISYYDAELEDAISELKKKYTGG